MNIAETMADYLLNLSDEEDGISEDAIVEYAEKHFKGKIIHNKFITGHGEWTAILVFQDKSVVKIHSLEGKFDVYVGEYNSGRAH